MATPPQGRKMAPERPFPILIETGKSYPKTGLLPAVFRQFCQWSPGGFPTVSRQLPGGLPVVRPRFPGGSTGRFGRRFAGGLPAVCRRFPGGFRRVSRQTATAERTEYRDNTAVAEKTEHQDRTATAEKTEYADEKTEDKTQYPAENRDNSYLAANQHMVKFADELRGINEQAALSFDRRKNPAEYDLKEKQEMLEAVTEAFNAANCGSSPACPCTGTSTAGRRWARGCWSCTSGSSPPSPISWSGTNGRALIRSGPS